jgi:hypothetical protein
MLQPCLYQILVPPIAFALLGACTDDVAPADQRHVGSPPDGPGEELRDEFRNLTPEPVIDTSPVRGCTAKAKCPNGVSLSCDVDGEGTCSGVDGIGVQCITYNNDGDPVESGGVCGGK